MSPPTVLEVLDFIDAANEEVNVTVDITRPFDVSQRQLQRLRAMERAAEARAAVEMTDARLIGQILQHIETSRRLRHHYKRRDRECPNPECKDGMVRDMRASKGVIETVLDCPDCKGTGHG